MESVVELAPPLSDPFEPKTDVSTPFFPPEEPTKTFNLSNESITTVDAIAVETKDLVEPVDDEVTSVQGLAPLLKEATPLPQSAPATSLVTSTDSPKEPPSPPPAFARTMLGGAATPKAPPAPVITTKGPPPPLPAESRSKPPESKPKPSAPKPDVAPQIAAAAVAAAAPSSRPPLDPFASFTSAPAEPRRLAISEPPRNSERPVLPLLVDVTPLSLCVETVKGFRDVIIARNTPVPCEQSHTFVTAANDQEIVRVRVGQGESEIFDENTLLGEVELQGLRKAARGEVQIVVTFSLDTDGMLDVRAADAETGQASSAKLRLVGLPDTEEVGRMTERHLLNRTR
jgi:molecular chaperone DnaK